MPRALKVFRTPIGFHDAYVAAPTKKAALAAWGSTRNLFALGEAEEIVDAELKKAPLAKPGTVVRRLRGTAAEQIAALPADEKPGPGDTLRAQVAPVEVRSRPRPLPKRDAVDAIEGQIEGRQSTSAKAMQVLDDKIDALRREREALRKNNEAELRMLEAKREDALGAYESAMARWREGQGSAP